MDLQADVLILPQSCEGEFNAVVEIVHIKTFLHLGLDDGDGSVLL
jgi:hypothetical protein